MARVLYDDLVEYKDGTPATTSQMAKDVVTFLSWSADRNHDQRKRFLFKVRYHQSASVVSLCLHLRYSASETFVTRMLLRILATAFS